MGQTIDSYFKQEKNSTQSKIKYFAPNYRVVERLKCYGVRAENIFLTGFPLPEENTGGRYLGNLRHDLGIRLTHLDPKKIYTSKYALTIDEHLGTKWPPPKTNGPPILMFAVGGAGAQRELGVEIVKNLAQKIAEFATEAVIVAFNPNNLYFTGLSNLFAKPEFVDRVSVTSVSQILDKSEQVLPQIIDLVSRQEHILIGSNNPFGNQCSFVATPFGSDGFFGILGPMRMDYEKNLSVINFVKELVR
ncbi:hypothetical protein HZB93_01425 [Candidatus Falkowbacteria bacterium]|nr:hypothetical protein [Candidatus Falkowbacteria bacterium]